MAERDPLSVVVLAAGRGTRMRNDRPKVLHEMAGLSLVGHVLETARTLGPERLVVVLGAGMDAVAAEIARIAPEAAIVVQDPPLGTGHALTVALPALAAEGTVLVLYGDTPLLTRATLEALLDCRRGADAAVAVLGMRPPDPTGYGRLQVGADDRLLAIVEHKHCDPALLAEGFCNSGVLALAADRLRVLLGELPEQPVSNEYYLTDTVEIANRHGWLCRAVEGAWIEGQGVNTQAQLALVAGHFQERFRLALMDRGVTLQAPETVFLSADTVVEPGAVIEPFVVFGPKVRIASEAVIRAHSHLEGAVVGRGAEVGPFARLRPGAVIEAKAKVGNFVEVKNTTLGTGAKASHLTYLGDCEVGPGANIGAGTITCNYDGFGKHRTVIGAGAFVGSNTAFVAPVSIGEGAITGAGSVVTGDVPADGLALSRPPQRTLPGAARRLRERLAREKTRGKG
jgi:bifunctional UDP-N-acetylglucosamine pyrophosphorylase / glucosamine-1-phosphate N-acetyltransferase